MTPPLGEVRISCVAPWAPCYLIEQPVFMQPVLLCITFLTPVEALIAAIAADFLVNKCAAWVVQVSAL